MKPLTGLKKLKLAGLEKISQLVLHYYKRIAIFSILIALLCLVFTFKFLTIDANQDNLISNQKDYQQYYMNYLDNFEDNEFLTVVIEVPDNQIDLAKNIINNIDKKLKTYPELFPKIYHRMEKTPLFSKGLLLLEQKEFDQKIQLLKENKTRLENLASINNWTDFFNYLSNQLNQLTNQSNPQNDTSDRLTLIKEIIKNFDQPDEIKKIDTRELIFSENDIRQMNFSDGYLFSPDQKLAFIQILPQKNYHTTKVVEEPIKKLREILHEIKTEFPDWKMGVTGKPALQHDELKSTGQDSIYTGLLAFIGVSIIFILFFGFHRGPLLALISLACGLSFTIGLVTLVLGHLNLLTTVFAVILIGLGIDYGIHFLFRYQSERAKGIDQARAIKITIHQAGGAIITGAISSAVAFLSALFTDFLGLKELGFVAGSGLIFCLLTQIITLPSLLLWFQNKQEFYHPRSLYTNWYEKHLLTRPKRKIAVIILITLIGIPFLKNIYFEDNLLKLQDKKAESVIFEHVIIDNPDISSWYGVSLSSSLAEIKNLREKYLTLDSVENTQSMIDFLPENQIEKLTEIQKININLDPFTINNPEKNDLLLKGSLVQLKKQFSQLSNQSFNAGKIEVVENLESLVEVIDQKLKNFHSQTNLLAHQSENYFFQDLYTHIQNLKLNLDDYRINPQTIGIDDIPTYLKKQFIGHNQEYALYIYPKYDIWEKNHLENFVKDLRSIDPKVTGSPIQTYESADRMKKGFFLVGIITFFVVLFILVIDLNQRIDEVIAMVPLLIGLFWLAIFMGYFNIPLSLGNFFALPLLIGIGIDNGVHLIHNYREKKCLKELFQGVITPIFLSTITTIFSFGSLALVRHQGLASFGQIMTIGCITCFLASFLLVPTLIVFREKYHKSRQS